MAIVSVPPPVLPMAVLAIAILLLSPALLAQKSVPAPVPAPLTQTPPAARSLTAPQQPINKPKRVIVTDLSSFHIKQKPAPNQVGGGTRGNDAQIVLCAPAQGVSSTTRPLFVWRGGSRKVTLDLLDERGEVLEEFDATGNSLRYPADAAPLLPGKNYSWKVAGSTMDNLPAPVAFNVVPPPAGEQFHSTQDPLTLAQLYIKAGLWYDTLSTLEDALKATPANPDLDAQLQTLYQATCPATP